ncbi:YbaB/EbfC family nucleoid-associated protein ['Camptotheca acuminata' phytoplasma]|uniref:YbaB/EbfC family nucleoid-associated protein n=1 Tax='Camptotheca acuminata' phytoplasma TaxID=3239192 RepID=UPI00351AA18F
MEFLDKLIKIEKNFSKEQKKLELKEFTSKIGGIMIVMQGTKQVVDVQIQNLELLKNLDLIQETILLSFNDALQQVEKASQKLLKKAVAYQDCDF